MAFNDVLTRTALWALEKKYTKKFGKPRLKSKEISSIYVYQINAREFMHEKESLSSGERKGFNYRASESLLAGETSN